jgi:uncharacterized protein with FMN-binding domain
VTVTRIVTWLLSTVTVLVLLFGYHTSTAGGLSADTVAVSRQPTTETTGGSPASGADATTRTVTGSQVQTEWGPVQVEVSVSEGTITGVSVVQYPTGNSRDEDINGYALPILVDETLAAQSADIDMVSGATVTSEGYRESLQSALDEAGL